jgi:hypothetical protein
MPRSFDLDVALRGARLRVWRRFLLSTGATFYDLHDAIQRACGWWSYHLFAFRAVETGVEIAGIPDEDGWGDVEVPDAKGVRLQDWFGVGRKKVEYEYDFGDSWIHDVKLLGVVEHEEKHKRKLLGGARAFPHEDCGGMDGYRRCVTFVKTGKDPWGEGDDDGLRRWLGGWHPERFDLEGVRKKFDTRPAKKPALVVATSAQPPRPPRERNAWCAALGVDVPDVAAVATRKTPYGPVRLSELVVVALVEKGAPMTDAEVVAHLSAAGVSAGTGDLAKSLKRALASTQAPILRDHEGRLTLDLKNRSLDLMMFRLGLRGPKYVRPEPAAAPPAEGALTREEVDAAFQGRISYSDTKARFVAAVLDAERAPLRLEEIADRYEAYGGVRARFTDADKALLAKREDIVVDGDVLRLSDDADLRSMREAIRTRARGALEAKQREAAAAVWRKEADERERGHRVDAARLRRAAFACGPSAAAPTSIEGFDFTAGERVTFAGGERGAFARWISGFDVVAGVRPHVTLGACGVDFHRFSKVVDLLPAKKTLTVEGRPVPINWEAIVVATLGVSHEPYGIGALVALYRYALLHDLVWMTVPGEGFVAIRTDARMRGDVEIYDALREAAASGAVVTMWVSVPPEVAPRSVMPLNAVVRGRVVAMGAGEIVVEDEGGRARTVNRSAVKSIDVSGGDDFAWRLPVTWRA